MSGEIGVDTNQPEISQMLDPEDDLESMIR
jgi:hypothetical protein